MENMVVIDRDVGSEVTFAVAARFSRTGDEQDHRCNASVIDTGSGLAANQGTRQGRTQR